MRLPQARDQLRSAGVGDHLPEPPVRRSCAQPEPEPQQTPPALHPPVFPGALSSAAGGSGAASDFRRGGPGAWGRLGGPLIADRVGFRAPSLLLWLAGVRPQRLPPAVLPNARRRRGGLATTAQLEHARAEAQREAAVAEAEAEAVAEAVASVASAAGAAVVQDDRLAAARLGFV